MSSWLSLSLPNPFKSSDDQNPSAAPPPQHPTSPSHDHSPPLTAGFKEDLSVLGRTIGRQLRGVAAFLAPPPSPPPHSTVTSDDLSSSQTFVGIKNDLVEIGGSFKTSLSLLSSNKAVTEISRFASNLLQFQDEGNEIEADEEHEEAVGITEEVLYFVQEISLRPECWTHFPLSLHNDFDMSHIQREHAATVERLVPSFATLRNEICSYLSEEQFWMIYFILLLPRLNENDSKVLSTTEIIEVREILLQKLQNKKHAPVEISEDSDRINSSQEEGKVNNSRQDIKSPSQEKEVPAEVVNVARGMEIDVHENAEQWLEEEDIDTSVSVDVQKQPENEEDVSFSDLEDDDSDLSGRLSGLRPAESKKVSSHGESYEWVRLNQNSPTLGGKQKAGQSASREKDSSSEESNDWLTVDDIDLDSLSGV